MGMFGALIECVGVFFIFFVVEFNWKLAKSLLIQFTVSVCAENRFIYEEIWSFCLPNVTTFIYKWNSITFAIFKEILFICNWMISLLYFLYFNFFLSFPCLLEDYYNAQSNWFISLFTAYTILHCYGAALLCIQLADCHLLHDIWAIDSLKSLLAMPSLLSWWCADLRRNWAQWGKSSDGIHFKSSRFQGVGSMLLPSHVSISSHKNDSLKSRQIYTIFFSTIFLPVPMPPVAWFFLFFLSRFTRNLFQLRRNSSSSFKWSIDFRIATIWCIYSFKALFK